MRRVLGRGWKIAFVAIVAGACGGTQDAPIVPPPTTATPTATRTATATATTTTTATATATATATTGDDASQANAFALHLYAAIKKGEGNVAVCGASLRDALAIPYLGARGDTAREIATALGLASDAASAVSAAKAESQDWQTARGKAELVTASRLFADKSSPPSPDFVKQVDDAFGAGASQPVDFLHAADAARDAMNKWVGDKTAGKIHDLFPKGSVDASSRLVVANAIYFKGTWEKRFAVDKTADAPFHVTASKAVTTKTMHELDPHAIAEVPGAKVLRLGYQGTTIAMMIVLPNDPADFAKIEASLSDSVIAGYEQAFARKRVDVALPRFSFYGGGSMNAPLRELGVATAFTDAADFSGISATKLKISETMQRTYVAVDEQGTEAAAASGVVMTPLSAVLGPVVDFHADHPFLFLLRDEGKKRILFVGRVTDPTSKGTQ